MFSDKCRQLNYQNISNINCHLPCSCNQGPFSMYVFELSRKTKFSDIYCKIFTPGISASLLGGKHVKMTRNAYLISLVWMELLRQRAYDTYCQSVGPHEPLNKWEQRIYDMSPTAFYWGHIVRNFLLTYFSFIRNQRQGNWLGTLESIEMLCPYFFALGHTNYSRWVPMFLRDMAQLPTLHPDVHDNFMKGHFVVHRSDKKFSLMGLDQSQEHSIRMLKEDGGPKGLYNQVKENMVIELSRAEVLRVVEEFEDGTAHINPETNQEHPERSTSEQQKLLSQVSSLLELVEEQIIVDPYLETETELITLDTGEYMDPEVFGSLKQMPLIGKTMYDNFVQDRLQKCTTPLSDIIPKPHIYTFLQPPPVNLPKVGNKTSYKSPAAVVTQMFISLQARPDSKMAEFFMHENAREPPALSDKGKLRTGTKSQILGCLPSMPGYGHDPTPKQASVVILDMAAVIHMVRPTRAKGVYIGEYTSTHMLPFMESQKTARTTRMDAVWDCYHKHSLKNQTRTKRQAGGGIQRTRVSTKIPLPRGKDWQQFLSINQNKDDLFKYLSTELISATASTTACCVISTSGQNALLNQPLDLSCLSPTDHEEADSRMMLHLQHAIMAGHKVAVVRTVDSDVVVLSIQHYPTFQNLGLIDLWIGFGCKKNYRDIPVHEVSAQLGPNRCMALPFFHAFTGSDLTSSMFGIGKKTAWNAWLHCPEVTETMVTLLHQPEELTEDSVHMRRIEQLTVQMYNKNCSFATVNEARQLLFTHNLRNLECIPPTKAALYQHVKRAVFVFVFMWHGALAGELRLPAPADYGWTHLEDASVACSLLLHCSCNKASLAWTLMLVCTSVYLDPWYRT